MIKSTLKNSRYCPLVKQGFSNFLGLFQGIMANPVIHLSAQIATWLYSETRVFLKKDTDPYPFTGGRWLMLDPTPWLVKPESHAFIEAC